VVVRDRTTWTLYGLLGLVGFLLNGLGAVLAPLQRDLHVERAQVAYYPSLFAVGLLTFGTVGGRVVARVGRLALARGALVLLAIGALLLCSGTHRPTMAGAALLGLGAAMLVQMVPAGLSQIHGPQAPVALGEANALSSVAAVAGPLCVAAAIGAGLGWRIGYLLVPLVAIVVLGALMRPMPPPPVGDHPIAPAGAGLGPGRLLGRWVDLLLAISAEFCMVFWTADALGSWHSAGAGQAAALTGVFIAGMAMVRAGSQRLMGDRPLSTITGGSAGVAVIGFAGFWAAPNLAWAAVGLLVTGMGVALLYPVTVARVVAAWPDRPDAASSRAALASGLAIGVAPLVLALLAGVVGLRTAYLVVPILLMVLLGRAASRRSSKELPDARATLVGDDERGSQRP
jgi:MFS family permease